MLKRQVSFIAAAIAVSGLAGRSNADTSRPAPAPLPIVGAVYTASNDPWNNTVLAFQRDAGGGLRYLQSYNTGGRGSGGAVDPLQSQNSLLLTPDHKFLIAANAGSGSVSVFGVKDDGSLTYISSTPSGGGFPVSLALHGNLLYVLNAGGAGNVTGFWLMPDTGRLRPVSGGTHLLSGASAGGASIDFSPDGMSLVAAERLTNLLDTFGVGPDGRILGVTSTASSGNVPFAVTFTSKNVAIVAEAGGNPAGGSAVSSYRVQPNGTLAAITASLPTGFNAACWDIATKNGKFAYLANAGSSQITAAGVSGTGALSILGATSIGAGSIPLDLALSADDHYLYTLAAGKGTIACLRINRDGTLTSLGSVGALPAASGQNGLAAF